MIISLNLYGLKLEELGKLVAILVNTCDDIGATDLHLYLHYKNACIAVLTWMRDEHPDEWRQHLIDTGMEPVIGLMEKT